MLFAQLSSAVVREFGFMQAPDHEEAAACCAPLQRKGLAGGRCQAEEDAVVAFTFGKFPQWASAPEHVIDGIENKGFAGIGRAIEHVEARFEAHGCRRPLRPEKAQMTENRLTFLITAQGNPFTAAGFGNWFRDVCREAKLPEPLHLAWPAKGRSTSCGRAQPITSSWLGSGERTLIRLHSYGLY